MSEDAPTVAEEFAMGLAAALYRKGVLTGDDFAEIAGALGLKAEESAGEAAERLYAAAHLATCVPIEADAISASQWSADKAREGFRVIDGGADT